MIECAGTCHLHPERLPPPAYFPLILPSDFPFSRSEILPRTNDSLRLNTQRLDSSPPVFAAVEPRYLLPARPGGLNPPRDPREKADLGAVCGRRGLTDPDATLSSSRFHGRWLRLMRSTRRNRWGKKTKKDEQA